jgi:hypothetical protein
VQNQEVKQGEVVGFTGSPDSDCDSRPHLHLEVRSADYFTTYNPVTYIDADWDSLALIGSFSNQFFQMNLENARQWMSLDDQPNVRFGGARLNDYRLTWPPQRSETPAATAPLARDLPPLAENTRASLRRIGYDACCWESWWHPTQPNVLFTMDGTQGSRAVIFQWNATAGELNQFVSEAPPPFYSVDYTHKILKVNNTIQIQNTVKDEMWLISNTEGQIPAINVDNTRLMWSQPAAEAPGTSIIVSDVRGANPQEVAQDTGLGAMWLDTTRLLLTKRDEAYTTFFVLDVISGAQFELGKWYRPRGMDVAPGGERMLFYLMGQPNAADNGLYVLNLVPDAIPQKLDWFGAYRWRDGDSVYYVPFNPNGGTQQLMLHDLSSGQKIALTDPATQHFSIMNGQWSVNADGSRILFRNAADRNLWFIEVGSP